MQPADLELRHNLLGMTETGSVALMDPDESDQPEHRRGSFGRPVADLEARVVDPRHRRRVRARRARRAVVPGPEPHGGLLRARAPRGVHRRRLVPHRRRVHDRRRRLPLLPRPPRRHDQDGRGQRVAPRGRAGAARGHRLRVRDRARPPRRRARARSSSRCWSRRRTRWTTTTLRRALRDRLSAYKVPRRFLRLSRTGVPMLSSGKPDVPAVLAMFDDLTLPGRPSGSRSRRCCGGARPRAGDARFLVTDDDVAHLRRARRARPARSPTRSCGPARARASGSGS